MDEKKRKNIDEEEEEGEGEKVNLNKPLIHTGSMPMRKQERAIRKLFTLQCYVGLMIVVLSMFVSIIALTLTYANVNVSFSYILIIFNGVFGIIILIIISTLKNEKCCRYIKEKWFGI
ncbi:MAG: hypothetical protein ACTSUE_13910 [Promethearchaeota archaeon]